MLYLNAKIKTGVKESITGGDKANMVSNIYRTEDQEGLNTESSYNFSKKSTVSSKNQLSKNIRDTVLQKSGGSCQCTNRKYKKGSYNNILVERHYYFYGSGDFPDSCRVICHRYRDSCYPKTQPDWGGLQKTLALLPTLQGNYEGNSILFDLGNSGLFVNLLILSISTYIM